MNLQTNFETLFADNGIEVNSLKPSHKHETVVSKTEIGDFTMKCEIWDDDPNTLYVNIFKGSQYVLGIDGTFEEVIEPIKTALEQ